jgi:hypothetical protein
LHGKIQCFASRFKLFSSFCFSFVLMQNFPFRRVSPNGLHYVAHLVDTLCENSTFGFSCSLQSGFNYFWNGI